MLLTRRPEGGLLGGLWELPGGVVETGEPDGASLRAILTERIGAALTTAEALGAVAHTFSHLHLDTTVFTATLRGEGSPLSYPELRWVPLADVDGMALSTLALKTLVLGRAGPPA